MSAPAGQGGPNRPCPKCGGGVALAYHRHCRRADCDHKYCGAYMDARCVTCGFREKRRPLDEMRSDRP